jgi:FixJ family two-component response regulator
VTLKWSKCVGLSACYGAVTAVLVAETIDKGRVLRLHTVESHRWHIMEEMDLQSTAELVLSAVRRDLVS